MDKERRNVWILGSLCGCALLLSSLLAWWIYSRGKHQRENSEVPDLETILEQVRVENRELKQYVEKQVDNVASMESRLATRMRRLRDPDETPAPTSGEPAQAGSPLSDGELNKRFAEQLARGL